jgi:Lrp/AsnC family transcriptional regulator
LKKSFISPDNLIYGQYYPKNVGFDVINEPDLRILRELQRDSDQSLDQISDQVGVSRNAVWKRIRTMEQNGVIASRVAILNAAAFDLNLTVFIQLKTANHSKDWIKRLEKTCKILPQVQGAYRMSGDLDYLLRAVVCDIQDYDRLYQELIERLEPSDVSASFVMEKIVEHTRLPI